jgi:putative MATE family efflux protein
MSEQNSPVILGAERIGKLLIQYALPAIVAMTASSLYNMADSIFIGHGVGALAIAGLALTFPLMNLGAAFGSLVGVGAATLISVKLGQKDYHGASRILGNVLTLNLILGLLFTLICLPFLDSILYFFGASPDTLPYARDYMQIILAGNVVTHLYLGLNNVIRASGAPRYAMYATLASVIINCILNPLFIFVLDWGIKGSAWATVLSQVISLAWQIYYFAGSSRFIHFKKGIYALKKDQVKSIVAIGLAPFLMNICASLIIILINRGLKQYGGDMAIGAYGVVNRIAFLFAMIIMGLNQGMQPIAGYNYGARQFDRVKKALQLTILYATGVATLGFLICQLIPSIIVQMFTTHAELIETSVYGLHIVFAVFPLVGFQMVTVNFFQSIGQARQAIFLSLTRQLIFLLPCLLLLPPLAGVSGVWLSLPIADFISAIVSFIVLRRQLRRSF